MKKSLENILSITKLALASSLSALSMYAQQPVQIKTQDGNWNTEVPTTLYFKSTLGNTATDPKKDPTKQFKTQVYFSGRRTKEDLLEFMYITTDSQKPSLDAPTIDNNKTKILFYSDGKSSVEIKYQKAIMLNNKGEIKLEDTVPKEKASSTLMKFGINLTDKANETMKDYILLKTAGLLDINIQEGLTKYCEKQTQEIMKKAKEDTGYELAINNIPLWTRDTNFAIRNKQIGWIIGVSALSKDKKEVPIAIYHHLALKRDEKQEEGRLDTYTEAFTIPATTQRTLTCQSLENLEILKKDIPRGGVFMTEDSSAFVFIKSDGKMFTVKNSTLMQCFPIKVIYARSSQTEGEMHYTEINSLMIKGKTKINNLNVLEESTQNTPQKETQPKKEENISPGLIDKIPSRNKETIRNVGRLFGK